MYRYFLALLNLWHWIRYSRKSWNLLVFSWTDTLWRKFSAYITG